MNAAPRFSVVSNELPDPPYDKHVMANGYGFDLDVTRMQNSDSWVLCPADIRPWMMMSWVMSWVQHPCGSLPSDDELIAARLGCSMDFLQVHRRFILRGWTRHADGRLYHPVVTEEVMKMVESREKWKLKKRGQRNEKQADSVNVPGDTGGTPTGVHGVSPLSPSLSPSTSLKEEGKPSLSEPPSGGPDAGGAGEASPDEHPAARCPHQSIIAIYHEALPELPAIVASRWNGSKDAQALQARWREDRRHQSLEFWTRFFAAVRANPHWMGQNERGWAANLRWLVQRTNFDKVIERMVNVRREGGAAHG